MTKAVGYTEWSFYANNKEILICLPNNYHCYYKWKDEYLDYIYMFKYNKDGLNNILIASYGSPVTLHMEWDSILNMEKYIIIESDTQYTLAYSSEEQRYYIRKYFQDANFNFVAIKVTREFLTQIKPIFHSITIKERDCNTPINPSFLAEPMNIKIELPSETQDEATLKRKAIRPFQN